MKASLTIQITSSSPPKYLFLFLLYNISSLPSFPSPSNFFSFSTKFPFLFHQISPASPPIFCPSIFSPCTFGLVTNWIRNAAQHHCEHGIIIRILIWDLCYQYRVCDLRYVMCDMWYKICAAFCLVSYIFIRTRPSILCLTHQMSHKKRNCSVGLTR